MDTLVIDALHVVFLHPDYRYSYQSDVRGRGIIWLSLRRQLRELNGYTAEWYARWLARGLLEKLYDDVVPSIICVRTNSLFLRGII